MIARRALARVFELAQAGVGLGIVVGFAFAEALGDAADLLRGHEPIRDEPPGWGHGWPSRRRR